MLMISSGFIVIEQNREVKAEVQTPITLDLNLVKEVAERLSRIVNTSYTDKEQAEGLAKGRYFGTQGEHDAAIWLAGKMKEIGLYNVSNDNYTFANGTTVREPFFDKINNSNLSSKYEKITCKFDITAKTFTITNTTPESTTKNKKIDCYISPRWTIDGTNLSSKLIPINDTEFKTRLSRSFNYTNLPIHKPPIIDQVLDFIETKTKISLKTRQKAK